MGFNNTALYKRLHCIWKKNGTNNTHVNSSIKWEEIPNFLVSALYFKTTSGPELLHFYHL